MHDHGKALRQKGLRAFLTGEL